MLREIQSRLENFDMAAPRATLVALAAARAVAALSGVRWREADVSTSIGVEKAEEVPVRKSDDSGAGCFRFPCALDEERVLRSDTGTVISIV